MNKKLYLTALILPFLLIIFVLLSIRSKAAKRAELFVDTPPFRQGVKFERRLQPSNPEDFGMVVFDDKHILTEGEARALIKEKIAEIKSKYPKETLEKVNTKIKEPQAKTKKKLAQIEESIVKYQELIKKEPYNEQAKLRLQNLLLLKAIARELPQNNN